MDNYISRQAAIDLIESIETERLKGNIELIYAPAIKGLRALPPAQPEQLGTNLAEVGTDCISRQSAIDAFNTNLNELVVGGEENAKTVENYLNRVLDKIKCLPSAQPEIKQQAINSSDCIDRQAAIDTFYELWGTSLTRTVDAIKQLPSIQPKRGKWVLVCDNNGMHFVCDKCGAWRYYQGQNFCGECGADMREVTE